MSDVWTRWDARVKQTGRLNLVASELSDLELVTLLANEDPDRREEKRILKHEAYLRMIHQDARADARLERPPERDLEPRLGPRPEL